MPATNANPLSAPSGLITPASSGSDKKNQFLLFSDSWLQLQSYVGSAMQLPITNGDFETKYGNFTQSSTITDCISAMRSVRETSTEFGDPKSLRQQLIKDPNLLATPTAPDQIYTHTVWLGQRVHQTAGTLVSGYNTLSKMLPKMPSDQARVDALKQYLFDKTMGPIPLADRMAKEAGILIQKLGKFEAKMNEYNAKFASFTSASSQMRTDINTQIGAAEQQIKDLEGKRDEAYKAWKDFTIAACTTSVGCALIGAVLAPFTGGISLLVGGAAAIATGVGLGVKAAQCRGQYNSYCDMIQTETVEMQKKIRLRSDLGDFDKQMGYVGPAMGSFLKNLQAVEGIWVQMNTDLVGLANSLTPDNFADSPFMALMQTSMAVDSWKSIDDSAKDFTVSSLVDYQSVAFGDKMPEKAAA